jgi:hypothetical protein
MILNFEDGIETKVIQSQLDRAFCLGQLVGFNFDQRNAGRSLWSPNQLLTVQQLYLYQASTSSDPNVTFLRIYVLEFTVH